MTVADLQKIASRGSYAMRVTLDYLYAPYNNWSCNGGESAYQLEQVVTYLQTWPRCQLWIEQPVGWFVPCTICDLQTLGYLFFTLYGAAKPTAYQGETVSAGYKQLLCTEGVITQPPPPSGGPNLPMPANFITESGVHMVTERFNMRPCYRDWVTLGLGPPPRPYVPPSGPPSSWAGSPG